MINKTELKDSPLWIPSEEAIASANMTKFISFMGVKNYEDLYGFSIHQPEKFWSALWEFCGVIAQQKGNPVLDNPSSLEKAIFFPQATLNYAENLLRRRDHGVAIEFYDERGHHETLTFHDLYHRIAQLSEQLRTWGVMPGDRVAGYLPNIPQTIIAMLATTSIGGIWSSCSPDFGVRAVLDRFNQICPKILFTADGSYYHGKELSCLEKLPEIVSGIPSLEHVVVIPYTKTNPIPSQYTNYQTLINQSQAQEIQFEPLPFNHPLFILFSSGTTGMPKCIVHGAGGTLLQHLKEHQLHCDVKAGDRLFYFTTCGWMMWNWLVSGLASGASLILFEGSPFYPTPQVLFDTASKTGMTHFGTSAKYIDTLAKLGVSPQQYHPYPALRMMMSTGSPLSPESFDYVYREIKSDLCLASISGGTDIISCFALGNPIAPVWRGELQTPGLGMKIEVFDERGNSVLEQKGELVCTAPFPSRPLGFWNDSDGQRYHAAYYDRFDNVWHHGDFVEKTKHGGLIIHGRSDAVLNPGGVRIGTAEIYRQVEQIPQVLESLAVGQNWNQDVRIILFVRLQEGMVLDDSLREFMKQQIRQNTTPRHVPSKIIQVSDIPRTKNGKLVELAVRNVIHGQEIENKEILANPDALALYKNIPELQED
jgi:acetoacetyl-CoA synthetase